MRILLAIDGSYESMHAVTSVAQRPWGDDARVRVLTAVPPLPLTGVDAFGLLPIAPPPEHLQHEQARAERLVHRAAEILRGRGLRVEPVVRDADPRAAILDEAGTWDADLIVLGSHGQSRLERLLLGSVVSHVATHARCSVEIIRRKDGTDLAAEAR